MPGPSHTHSSLRRAPPTERGVHLVVRTLGWGSDIPGRSVAYGGCVWFELQGQLSPSSRWGHLMTTFPSYRWVGQSQCLLPFWSSTCSVPAENGPGPGGSWLGVAKARVGTSQRGSQLSLCVGSLCHPGLSSHIVFLLWSLPIPGPASQIRSVSVDLCRHQGL